MININLKWKKEIFSDVEVDMENSIREFAKKVQEMTKVPVSKQKILIKGKLINIDARWEIYTNVENGATLVLVGTAEGEELKRSYSNLIGLATGSAGDASYQLPRE